MILTPALSLPVDYLVWLGVGLTLGLALVIAWVVS